MRHLYLRMLALIAVAVLLICAGCGRRNPAAAPPTTTEETVSETPPDAPPITSDDLKEAERIVKAFWDAVIADNYAQALSYTEMATLPEEQWSGWEQRLRDGYASRQFTRVMSVGPARQDPRSRRNLLVTYSIDGSDPQAGEAVVRRPAPNLGWLISGGI